MTGRDLKSLSELHDFLGDQIGGIDDARLEKKIYRWQKLLRRLSHVKQTMILPEVMA